MRAVALAVALSLLLPHAALADTVSVSVYRDRLEAARTGLATARTQNSQLRVAAIANVRAVLARTDAVSLPSGGTLVIDDARLAERLDTSDAGIDAAVARLDARLAVMRGVGAPSVDPATSDARLRDALRGTAGQSGGTLLDVIAILVARFLAGLRGPRLEVGWLWTAIGIVGVAVILFIIATLGRGLRERVRREVLVADRGAETRADPLTHLRAADAAAVAGRPRESIHALYLYVITTLASRELIRYDPSFTDRELLAATVAIPHADALRDLVSIYERSWFGIREPSTDEARRARDLALRVAP